MRLSAPRKAAEQTDAGPYDAFVDRLLHYLFLVLIPGIPIIAFRIHQIGWNAAGVLQLSVAILMLVLVHQKTPIPHNIKLGGTIVGIALLSLSGILNLGPLSVGLVSLVAVLSLAGSFLGLRAGLALLAGMTLLLSGIGWLYLSGSVTPATSFTDHHLDPSSWLIFIAAMVLISLLLIGVNSSMLEYWSESNRSLEERNRQYQHSMDLNQAIVGNMVSGYFRARSESGAFTYLSTSARALLWASEDRNIPTGILRVATDPKEARRVLASATERPDEVHQLRVERELPAGVRQWLLIRIMAWRRETGEIDGVQGIIEDISELRRSEQRFREMFDSAPEAITMIDADTGLYLDANPQATRLHGLTREDMIGNIGPWDLSPPLQPDGRPSQHAIIGYLDLALQGETPRFEWDHIDQDGAIVPCEVSLARMSHPTQRLIRASVVNISDRKQALAEREELQEQLAHSRRMDAIGRLTGGVAHDFNNLLAVILGNLELLKDYVHDDDAEEFVEASIKATQRGADLTRNMLSFARKATLEPKTLNLNEIVGQTQAWATRVLPATIEVDIALRSDLWFIEADESSMQSALLNLILNARDAMPKGGKLAIKTENLMVVEEDRDNWRDRIEEGPYVLLTVTDSGIGIEGELIDQIFDPFFTTKGVGEGSGLGLPMVLGFVGQSGGTIAVTSEPGKGTTFKLLFPASGETVVARDPMVGLASHTRRTPATILVVEDEPQVLKTLSRSLRGAGYGVLEAASGEEALKIFEASDKINLLVTDIVMPGGLLGPELARRLRAIDDELPVILLTGYADDRVLHDTGIRPADLRLTKPVARAQLLNAVEKSLEGATAQVS